MREMVLNNQEESSASENIFGDTFQTIWISRKEVLFILIFSTLIFSANSLINLELVLFILNYYAENSTSILSTILFRSLGLCSYLLYIPLIPIAVKTHNLIFDYEGNTKFSSILRWGKAEKAYLRLFFVPFIVLLAITTISVIFNTFGLHGTRTFQLDFDDLSSVFHFFSILILVILSFVFPFLFITRFIWIFPSSALGDKLTLKQSWRISRGKTWRIFGTLLLAFLPLVLFEFLFNLGVMPFLKIESTIENIRIINYVLSVPTGLIRSVYLIVGTICTSLIYHQLSEKRYND